MVKLLLLISGAAFALNVHLTVNPGGNRTPISPYIYGGNQTLTGAEGWTVVRQGGNRMTGYNWENNASSAGSDWYHSSDNYLTGGMSASQALIPGITVTSFHDAALAQSRRSLITLPLAGYVSRDKNGTVSQGETAPSARWREVKITKGAALSLTPDTGDGFVYLDEMVNFLIQKYGPSTTSTGIHFYNLDNEPALWPSTHPRIHPLAAGCGEVAGKGIAASAMVKGLDAGAEIFGPVLYGFAAYQNLQNAPDWNAVKGSARWFIDYYLARMKHASDSVGKRLLDVLDLHWYSEAQGGGERIVGAANPSARANAEARVQAPRTLWDSTYIENSWIGQWGQEFLPLIPKIQKSIDAHNPGTKISFSEYNYGGENHISGGIATADVLGIYGKWGVYAGFYWQMESATAYTSAGFKIFRNYDGLNGAFGALGIPSATDDVPNSSVYASLGATPDSLLHIVVINKNFDSVLTASFTLSGARQYASARVFGFDQVSAAISEKAPFSIYANTFSLSLPALSVYHLVLKPQGISAERAGSQRRPNSFAVYPNPAQAGSPLHFVLPAEAPLRLEIFDAKGAKVFAGSRIFWNGRLGGRPAPAGVYTATLTAKGGRFEKRFVVF